MTGFPTHYEVLGVDENATEADIKRAFRGLIRQLHPDTGGNNPARAALVTEAFDVLSRPDSRYLYDADLRQARERTQPRTASSSSASRARATSKPAAPQPQPDLTRCEGPTDSPTRLPKDQRPGKSGWWIAAIALNMLMVVVPVFALMHGDWAFWPTDIAVVSHKTTLLAAWALILALPPLFPPRWSVVQIATPILTVLMLALMLLFSWFGWTPIVEFFALSSEKPWLIPIVVALPTYGVLFLRNVTVGGLMDALGYRHARISIERRDDAARRWAAFVNEYAPNGVVGQVMQIGPTVPGKRELLIVGLDGEQMSVRAWMMGATPAPGEWVLALNDQDTEVARIPVSDFTAWLEWTQDPRRTPARA
ncbi:J domain-containing protein [Pseudoclavibacter sp. VKM Ac-2867]|uniref:J domain-containing protein n=1 Tax=Pseudoclavibacter sp. VKM Ac-2867 TaxID=2783829 RepID=UPI00188CFF59|nr:J domain-containing protein [Pseudoclavibacter sp. VKM Ac-2867]MBF4459387.1 J domain-containing protein [Pseudoclavibacter sp. VKM Ac-2867]